MSQKNQKKRIESDSIGSAEIDCDCLWGIHTHRAINNFRISGRRVPYSMISAIATVKRAAASANIETGYLEKEKGEAIIKVCDYIVDNWQEAENYFPVDALQGGAGTSTNMNVNEVVANLALKNLGKEYGDYEFISPLDHVNMHQSTNDVYPSALKIAAISGVRKLSEALSELQGAFQEKEKEFQSIIKSGRTEMQPAVPITLGQEFSAFAEAISRDRWRTFKCEERLRVVNIGGTAIGTGLTAPRKYIFRVIEILRSITGMGLVRNENVVDATANIDPIVEVSGILKAVATNLAKIATDLRFLHFLGEISLPPRQAGSSIMPGKVNPVMCESAVQVSFTVKANDMIIGEAASHATLQINEYMPAVAYALLDSIEILTNMSLLLAKHFDGITANPDICRRYLDENPSIATAFVPLIGYKKVAEIVKEYEKIKAESDEHPDIRTYLTMKLGEETVEKALSNECLTGLGDASCEIPKR